MNGGAVPRWAQVLRYLAPPVGAACGVTVALTFGNRTAPLWLTWAALAVAATTAAGLVCSYGLGRWQDLSKLCTIPAAWPVIWPVMAPLLAGAVAAFLPHQ